MRINDNYQTVAGLIIPNSTNFGNFVCLKLASFFSIAAGSGNNSGFCSESLWAIQFNKCS